MLNRTSIDAAMPLAQRLDERKLRVLPAENTPLMSLTLAGGNNLIEQAAGENYDISAVLQASSNSDAHRLAKADIISLASKSVCRLHDLVRGEVLPRIKELAANVQSYVNDRRVAAVLPYSIVMREIPAVFSNPVLGQVVERYPVPSNIEYPARDLAPITIDRLKDLCKTGMAGFDEEVNAVLSLEGDLGYAEILNVLTGRKDVRELGDNYLPGMLVVGQALFNEPEPGVNLTLIEYNERINRILGRAALACRGAISRYKSADQMGTLYSPEARTSLSQIVVMGKAYRKLLEAGLTPEALIGNEMAGRRFTAGQLIENKAMLEQIYNREMNLRAIKVQAEMAGIVRDAMYAVIGLEFTKAEGDNQAGVACMKELVEKINQHNCDDINTLVTEVVCEVFYKKADALTFIRLMNQAGKAMDADADPREVALMATFKYVNRWLCRQIGLVAA